MLAVNKWDRVQVRGDQGVSLVTKRGLTPLTSATPEAKSAMRIHRQPAPASGPSPRASCANAPHSRTGVISAGRILVWTGPPVIGFILSFARVGNERGKEERSGGTAWQSGQGIAEGQEGCKCDNVKQSPRAHTAEPNSTS